jgi:hypothetical protein
MRRRIDQLLGRVRDAQDEIVQRGLSAVHEAPPADDTAAAASPSAADPVVAPGDPADQRA